MSGKEILKIITDTSPAAASTVVGSSIGGLSLFDSVTVYATIEGGTGGVLDVYLQTSFDGGTTWYDKAHYTQLADGGAQVTTNVTLDQQPASSTPIAVGKGTTATPAVALAANTFAPGPVGDLLRAVYVAGVGTSAGEVQLFELHCWQRKL